MKEIAIDRFLEGEGFRSPDSVAVARAALEEAGVTSPRKQAIAEFKLPRAREAIDDRLARYCGRAACVEDLEGDPRPHVIVDPSSCPICSGSNNRRAMTLMLRALEGAGIQRVLIVGGTPRVHNEIRDFHLSSPVEVRLVDGIETDLSIRAAQERIGWSQLVIIWGSTPLPHKVSQNFSAEACGSTPRILVRRRGIEALSTEVVTHCRGGRFRP
jgi:hypothetical protein